MSELTFKQMAKISSPLYLVKTIANSVTELKHNLENEFIFKTSTL